MSEMQAIDIARRLAELGQTKEACQAYTLTVASTQDPEILFEAALYILQNDGNYQVSYDVLLQLYENPDFRQDAFAVLTEAFYLPNEKQLKTRYEKNCKLLSKYPYLFRKDFPKFEELPIRFYPYDDNSYVPFEVTNGDFGGKINFNHPQVTHYFFKNLDNPILAEDIFSQYELNYLNDNVRASEDIGRENHIYLHYSSWEVFCAHLQVLNLRNLLEKKKIVFLIGEEISRYPIDFKEEFGVDYSRFSVKTFRLGDFKRLIWHTQLSTHNGGDFFNEIFDHHPNLVMIHSVMLDYVKQTLQELKNGLKDLHSIDVQTRTERETQIKSEIFWHVTPAELQKEQNLFVLLYLSLADLSNLDLESRIMPVIFFQPHFANIKYSLAVNEQNRVMLSSEQLEEIHTFTGFKQFPYIKTFTPMRRITTSAAASTKFQYMNVLQVNKEDNDRITFVSDTMTERILNRSFMVDWQDRLYQDSVLVRFEDGKLNPKATFTALAEFLDIPYTETMTYCSSRGVKNVETLEGNVIGFDSSTVYRTYDEYMGQPERILLEYFFRDAYAYYGYDFQYYDGKPMDEERLEDLLHHIEVLDHYILDSYKEVFDNSEYVLRAGDPEKDQVHFEKVPQETREEFISRTYKNRLSVLQTLLNRMQFVNRNGQPLNFMPRLKLDPELLEQPLYH